MLPVLFLNGEEPGYEASHVQFGTHGNLQHLDPSKELWMLAPLSNWEVLCTTICGESMKALIE